jgi:hypothetical protein
VTRTEKSTLLGLVVLVIVLTLAGWFGWRFVEETSELVAVPTQR